MKKYLKMNETDNQLSIGNFCRIIKEVSLSRICTTQVDIFMLLFLNEELISESTINNYCVGCRAISNKYKKIYQEYQKKYNIDKLSLLEIVNNIAKVLNGNLKLDYTYNEINNNLIFQKLCQRLYNIAKNDNTVNGNFTITLSEYINNNNYYECLLEIIFYIILEKKQPIYEDDIIRETIENILNKTNISVIELEKFLLLNFKDGVNYIYELKKLVKENNSYACFEMGYMEYKGEIDGVVRYNKAYSYFQIAAKNNHPRACLLISEMLMTKKIGNKTEEDENKALNYLFQARKAGSIAALNKLGLYYLNKDKNKAIEYFNLAINEGYIYSYNNLGKIYEEEKNYKKAYECYLKSAEKEESWACNKLGEFYRKGIYVEKDYKKAFDYYTLATNVPINLLAYYSKYNLAKYFYQSGNYEALIEKDLNKAIELYESSSQHNIIEASFELLYIYGERYLKDKKSENLNKVNYYKERIENNISFNNQFKEKLKEYLKTIYEYI